MLQSTQLVQMVHHHHSPVSTTFAGIDFNIKLYFIGYLSTPVFLVTTKRTASQTEARDYFKWDILSFHSINLYIQQMIHRYFKVYIPDEIQLRKWEAEDRSTITSSPRRQAVSFLTGHDCRTEQLHRIGILPRPGCPLSSSSQPRNTHHLPQCSALCTDSKTALY